MEFNCSLLAARLTLPNLMSLTGKCEQIPFDKLIFAQLDKKKIPLLIWNQGFIAVFTRAATGPYDLNIHLFLISVLLLLFLILFSQVFPGTFSLEPVVIPTTQASSF
jgi:hypothetical protein